MMIWSAKIKLSGLKRSKNNYVDVILYQTILLLHSMSSIYFSTILRWNVWTKFHGPINYHAMSSSYAMTLSRLTSTVKTW